MVAFDKFKFGLWNRILIILAILNIRSYLFLGGTKDQYFERTFKDLPPHNQLILRYTVYPIDSWDGASVDDHYQVYVDGYYQRGWSFVHTSGIEVAKCGSSSWPEYPPVLAISTFIHSAPTVKIQFINMLNQPSNDESLGIRDIKMQFVNVTTPQNSICGRSTADKPLLAWPCQGCDTSHQYQNLNSNGVSTSGTCFECSESCATCNSAGCTTCYTGNYMEGAACKQCTNGCATCNSATSCLTCQSNLYMAANGCHSTCTYPLYTSESGGITYCNSPCSGSQYAMWDGSCSDTCPTTQFTDTKMASYKLCTFPCSITPVTA